MSAHAAIVPMKDSIATQLLAVVFAVYMGITLTVTLAHMAQEYYRVKDNIMEELQIFYETFQEGMTNSIWMIDYEQIDPIVKGMLRISTIVGVKIETADTHEIFAASGIILDADQKQIRVMARERYQPLAFDSQVPGLFGQSFPLVYSATGESREIGTVTIYSSSSRILQRVQYSFLFIVVNAIIKTVALWTLFLWISRRMLGKPLAILTEATRQLNLDNLENLQVNIHTRGRNELKVLEEAFHTMVKKLVLAKERLIALQRVAHRLLGQPSHESSMLFLFEELTHSVHNSAGVLYHLEEHRVLDSHQSPEWLKQLPNDSILAHLFEAKTPQVSQLSPLPPDHPLVSFYSAMNPHLAQSHWIWVRLSENSPYVMVIFRSAQEEGFDSGDMEYVKSLLHEAKMVRDNIQAVQEKTRMTAELRTAAAVQRALFPKMLPQLGNIELASFFESASETGGDWYGFMTEIQNTLYIMIGDVTGHGTPAALVTATASATCNILEGMYAQNTAPPSPSKLLEHLNRAVFSAGSPDFLMTFFIASIDLQTGQMQFSNAGHNFPVLRRGDGTLKHLLNANARLGHYLSWNFSESSIQLQPGDQILFFTDGLFENTNPQGEMWGEARLIRYVKRQRGLPIKKLVNAIVQEMYRFCEGKMLDDDVTVVACEVVGPFGTESSRDEPVIG